MGLCILSYMDLLQLMGLSQGIPSGPMQGSYSPMGDYQQPTFQSPVAQQAMDNARRPNLLEQAREMYPKLKNVDIGYKESMGARKDAYLEFWPEGETGGDYKRPKEFDMKKIGVEVYKPETQPKDIAGDVFSHHMMWTEPDAIKLRKEFENSLSPSDMKYMKQQHARDMAELKKENPKAKLMKFDEWYKLNGLPSYVRGYTFNQWSPEEIQGAYTPEQISILDKMKRYMAE